MPLNEINVKHFNPYTFGHFKMMIAIIKKNINYKIKGFMDSYKAIDYVLVDSSGTIATDGSIRESTVIMANAVINATAKLGRFCIPYKAFACGLDCNTIDFYSLVSGFTIVVNNKSAFNTPKYIFKDRPSRSKCLI